MRAIRMTSTICRSLGFSLCVLPVGLVASVVQAACSMEATVLAEGQPISGVSVSFRQAQNPFTTVGETDSDGRIRFETNPLAEGILALTVRFQRDGFGTITRLLWRQNDTDRCPARNLGSLRLEPDTASPRPSVPSGDTDGTLPSTHGRTLYVAPYEIYPAGNPVETERLNAIFDRVLINHILRFRTELRLPNPPAEISVEKLNSPISVSNAERIRGLGAALNALGIITGEGETRVIPGGQLYVDLVSEFRVVPVLQPYREHRVQIQDSIPFDDLSPFRISKDLKNFWGQKTMIALAVKELGELTGANNEQRLWQIRDLLSAVRNTMTDEDPLLLEVQTLMSYLDRELQP